METKLKKLILAHLIWKSNETILKEGKALGLDTSATLPKTERLPDIGVVKCGAELLLVL